MRGAASARNNSRRPRLELTSARQMAPGPWSGAKTVIVPSYSSRVVMKQGEICADVGLHCLAASADREYVVLGCAKDGY